jgi:hypothetical protein
MSNLGDIYAKMQVISVAFRMAMFGNWDLEYGLLGMLKGAVIGLSYILFPGI